jgi:hypothetical protein
MVYDTSAPGRDIKRYFGKTMEFNKIIFVILKCHY